MDAGTRDQDAGPRAAPPAAGAGRRWRWISWAVLLLTLAAFFLPAWLTHEQFLYRDNGRMHWQVKHYLAERFRSGQLPEWNPYNSLGAPLVAGAIDAVQHPFNLLLVLLPFPTAFKLWDLLSFVVAGLGACAWARRLGRSWPAAVAAGLGFALSGSLVGASDNLTYLTTLATIPWMFAAAHAWLDRPGPGALALVGLASWLCVAAGDPQAWGFAAALLLVYPLAFTRREPTRRRELLRGGQLVAAAVVGAAPVVLPVIAWLAQSSRGQTLDPIELERWNLPLVRLVEFALPHMYRDRPGVMLSPLYMTYGGKAGSAVPWVVSVYLGASLLVLAAMAALRHRQARWLLGLGALFTWMALGMVSGPGRILQHLPVLSGFRYWEKMAIWPSLLVPVAAAFGIDLVVEGRLRSGAGKVLVGLAAALLALQGIGRAAPEALAAWLTVPDAPPGVAAALAGNLLDGALHTGLVILVLGLVTAAVQRRFLRLAAAPLLALVAITDVFAANVRGYQLADPMIVEPRSPFGPYLAAQPGLQRVLTPIVPDLNRFPELRQFDSWWLQTTVLLEPCFNVAYRVGNFLPYSGMVPARADRYRRRLLADHQVPQVGLFGVGYLVVAQQLSWAAGVGAAPPYDVVVTDGGLPAYLVRLPHRERTYLAAELASVDRRGAMEFALEADPARTSRSVVEGPVPDGYTPPHGTARMVVDEEERVAVATEADGPALLVLNDIHAAGWEATVDGRPAAILPTNYLARGVWVEGGAHRVEFRYRTPLLREGWGVLLAGAAALAAGGAIRRRRRR